MIIRRILLALPPISLGWITVMALVMRFSDAAPAAVVLFPGPDFIPNLPDGVAVIAANSLTVTLSSDLPGFGATLYESGALLVLPAGLTGCLPLPEQMRRVP